MASHCINDLYTQRSTRRAVAFQRKGPYFLLCDNVSETSRPFTVSVYAVRISDVAVVSCHYEALGYISTIASISTACNLQLQHTLRVSVMMRIPLRQKVSSLKTTLPLKKTRAHTIWILAAHEVLHFVHKIRHPPDLCPIILIKPSAFPFIWSDFWWNQKIVPVRFFATG